MLNNRSMLTALIWAIPVILVAVLQQAGLGSLQTASLLLVIGGLTITAINWHEHRGGRSPTFIFLSLGCVFLCGRALPALYGGESQLATIGFTAGYEVTIETVIIFVLLALTSFFFVHVGSLIPRAPTVLLTTSRSDARIYLVMFVLLLPAYLYKNIYYFNYVMSSGGYIAIYQDASFLENVGLPVRVGALLCLAAFTLYFFHETDRKKSRLAVFFFLLVFSIELFIGLRGKFFVVALILLLFYKIRFGGSFSIRGLLILFGLVLALAILVEITRQGGSTIEGSLLIGFLVQQGITADITLIVLDDLQYFSQNSVDYFLRQFLVPFYSQPEVQQGWFLQNDISMRVMPEAYGLGYGSGSSYLAELYLLGGWAAVCIGSLFIGWLLSNLRRFYQGIGGAITFWVICGVAYYPKAMLQDPVHNLMRYAVPILFLAACCWLLRHLQQRKARPSIAYGQ